MPQFRIGPMQYWLMIPCLVFSKGIGITAGITARMVETDAWLAMAMGFGLGMLVLLGTSYLGSRFPDKTIVEYSELLLGRWLGKVIAALLAIYFMAAYAVLSNVITMHIHHYFLPETPYLVICLIWVLLSAYGIYLGIEVIVRFGSIGFLGIILITLTMLTGTVLDIKPINLLPLMDKGFGADLGASIYVLSDISVAILASAYLIPLLNSKKKLMTLSFWAMAAGAILVLSWPLFETMVIGPDLMKQYLMVCMEQIRCAQLTKYLPRYELIMVSFFVFGVLVQSLTTFYCAQYAIGRLTGVKNRVFLLVPLAAVLLAATYFLAHDMNNYINIITYPYSQVSTAFGIGLPVFLLLIALVRGKLGRKEEKSE
ncbi:MAG: GerAB/ArcD/ProY family transporter [Solirubrobacterales bacterium]